MKLDLTKGVPFTVKKDEIDRNDDSNSDDDTKPREK